MEHVAKQGRKTSHEVFRILKDIENLAAAQTQMDPENHENVDVQEAILAPAYNLLFLNTCLLVAS